MRASRGVAAAGLMAMAAMLAGSGAAHAEGASCEIPVIHAQPGGGAEPHGASIDPKIDLLKPYLTRPPFTSWHDFKLLDRKMVQMAEGGSAQFTLPNDRQATLTFLGHTGGPGEHRMRLQLVIDHREKKHRVLDTTFVLDEGGVVLHVGQRYQGGVLIVGVSCKTQH